MSEKTQQPTAKKLEDAKKKGQLPRSKLFTSAAVTLGGLAATLAFSEDTSRRFLGWTRSLLSAPQTSPSDAIDQGVRVLALCAAPSLVGAMGAALISAVAMSGLQFNADVVSPKLERIDITEGVKKLLSVRQLVDVLKGLAVAAIIGWIFWSAVQSNASLALSALHHDGGRAFAAMLMLLKPVMLKAAVVLLVLGVADWALARKRHIKDLMMSHQEVKQEHKNSDGDPHQKAKRKSLHKQLANSGNARGVQKATAVVVNPTHIAVALRYAEDECEAPYIVARGREEDALKIRKEAEALGIPVVRDIPLARSLIHYDVGEEVPEELYQAAAAILKVALETKEEEQS
ncbi:MAG: EscU/YscU/HrcU family type III secretion system export apparatus switch protein [Archangium sp.]|nr:EscU/YscU/HrcU family type III secretion system export apparatus switch protein [Archangium sp.]MDP3570336.1 EscU/YscU/HrcU family type III secretion system export apparatus switch protein [Archangium sp.]